MKQNNLSRQEQALARAREQIRQEWETLGMSREEWEQSEQTANCLDELASASSTPAVNPRTPHLEEPLPKPVVSILRN